MQAEVTTLSTKDKPKQAGAPVLRIAIPAPLFTHFDYLVPPELASHKLLPGCRVRVPFGRRSLVGIIVDQAQDSHLPRSRLKNIEAVLDTNPVIQVDILALLNWAASYYLHPVGEVISAALPAALREGKPVEPRPVSFWQATKTAHSLDPETLKRAPRQQQVLSLLLKNSTGLDEGQLNSRLSNWRPALQELCNKALVTRLEKPCLEATTGTPEQGPALNPEQHIAVQAIEQDLERHVIHLLHGVTGSGKTEVYLTISQQMIEQGKQVLVLVPEISLTPQLTERFQRRFKVPVAILHSGLNDQQRLCAWHAASTGHAGLIIGTRSAIFTPMPHLGLIIVDEEHDGSYKQQDSFSYNARDLALVRGLKKNIPVVLGSATPSLESLHNVDRLRYQIHRLQQRARNNTTTRLELLDLRNQVMHEGLSESLLRKIEFHLNNNGQVLLFINRRGFSPLLMCHECGWTTHCRHCDAHMTFHKHRKQLHCHHCGAESPAPTHCGECHGEQLIAIGSGTERIETFLTSRFPDIGVNRIDRDTTRKKGSLEDKLQQVHRGDSHILVGTQMLAKGHDFPNVTLVGILDTDQALYSADFRAPEHLAQLITQVAGRAGRADKPGEVMIQTHHPEHPLLQTLLHQGYEKFARAALAERNLAGLPPYKHLVMIRCSAIKKEQGQAFMKTAADLLQHNNVANIEVFGPVPAPMEKRAGRFRTQIMLQSKNRKELHQLLRLCIPQIQQFKNARQVRWSIDIDPYDTY